VCNDGNFQDVWFSQDCQVEEIGKYKKSFERDIESRLGGREKAGEMFSVKKMFESFTSSYRATTGRKTTLTQMVLGDRPYVSRVLPKRSVSSQ